MCNSYVLPYQSYIHKNKDWDSNIQDSQLHWMQYQSYIHKNKDWDFSFPLYELDTRSTSPISTRIRIETNSISLHIEHYINVYQSYIHKNKDWDQLC